MTNKTKYTDKNGREIYYGDILDGLIMNLVNILANHF